MLSSSLYTVSNQPVGVSFFFLDIPSNSNEFLFFNKYPSLENSISLDKGKQSASISLFEQRLYSSLIDFTFPFKPNDCKLWAFMPKQKNTVTKMNAIFFIHI